MDQPQIQVQGCFPLLDHLSTGVVEIEAGLAMLQEADQSLIHSTTVKYDPLQSIEKLNQGKQNFII